MGELKWYKLFIYDRRKDEILEDNKTIITDNLDREKEAYIEFHVTRHNSLREDLSIHTEIICEI